MESTGVSDKIQLSDTTAQLLMKFGKEVWISARGDRIPVHGKGNMQTYWLETKAETIRRASLESRNGEGDDRCEQPLSVREINAHYSDLADSPPSVTTKMERLVEWNVDILSSLLEQIVAARDCKPESLQHIESQLAQGDTVLEEFKEIITLPKVGLEDIRKRKDPNSIELDDNVVSQLRGYLTEVAGMYLDNEFHNFEHASHVMASVRKLLSRIVSWDNPGQIGEAGMVGLVDLVGHSYGM